MNSHYLMQDCLSPAGVNPSPMLLVWDVIQPAVRLRTCFCLHSSSCHSLFERQIILASSQHTKPTTLSRIMCCKLTAMLPSTAGQTVKNTIPFYEFHQEPFFFEFYIIESDTRFVQRKDPYLWHYNDTKSYYPKPTTETGVIKPHLTNDRGSQMITHRSWSVTQPFPTKIQ